MKKKSDFPLSKQLDKLWDLATEAHTSIQKDFANIDPVVGVTQNMRKHGVPADVMTIDCLRTRKRILIILHDEQPNIISYQFAFMDTDPEGEFEQMAVDDCSVKTLYQWIHGYFSAKG